jgi:hemerythrin-like domain-containing protein
MRPPRTLTEWLTRQHDVFRGMLGDMETVLKDDADAERFKTMLVRLLAMLSVHEAVERDLLYPAVLEHVKPLDPRLIDLFEEAHETVHEKIEALRSALEDRDAALGRLVAGADFIAMLREHLEEEEQTLFPLAASRVPEAVLRDLGGRAERSAQAAGRRG